MAPRKKTGRITIRTVAEDAGVSVAAVSKVLRDAYGVSEELRGKVQASMAKLHYRPHAAARGMRGQTYTLGILLPDLRNPFFADIMAGVNSALERTQYQPLLGAGHSATTIEHALVDSMVDRQMDGLILVAPRMSEPELVEIAETTPTVIVGHHRPEATAYDTVNDDDELGAQLVVRHLVEMGYRNIVYLALELPEDDYEVTVRRRIGYRAAMAEAGLARQINIVTAEQSARETQMVVRRLLAGRNPPEAIFCWTDFVALHVLSVARELGRSVPGDLAVVGYDNTSYCDLAQNALTSVDQSGQVLGLQAARLLVERIKGRELAEHLVVTPRLVQRESSRPRAAGKPSAPRPLPSAT
jgi:DNA-binding LacI/PurR family transcriptional regulator